MTRAGANGRSVLIVGATGYIGSAVVAEAVRRGHDVTAVTRSRDTAGAFSGARVVVADVSDPASIATAFDRPVDVVISCLACRSGLPRDFDAIDYRATLNVLDASLAHGAGQFILLSAICVRKPDLPLQLAKLKMEDALIRSGIEYTIIRPTAYFWVFDSQMARIARGRRALLVGTGDEARHNPIAREDLAEFMVACIDADAHRNRIHILGGPEVPGNVVTYREALTMIFEVLGREPRFLRVPAWMFRLMIRLTRLVGHVSRPVGAFSELAHIVYYYLHDDMRAPGYGVITLREHLCATTRKLEP